MVMGNPVGQASGPSVLWTGQRPIPTKNTYAAAAMRASNTWGFAL